MEERLASNDATSEQTAAAVESRQSVQRSVQQESPDTIAVVPQTAGASVGSTTARMNKSLLDNNESTTPPLLSARDSSAHHHRIPDLLERLADEKATNPTKQEIANSLLEILDDSTVPLSDQQLSATSNALSRSLHSLQSTLNAATNGANPNRLVSTHFSILRRICSHPSPLSTDAISNLVSTLSFWCYYVHRISPVRRTGIPDASLSLGSMGAFGAFGAGPTKRTTARSKRNSAASFSETGSESESDSTTNEPRWSTGQVRLDALKCLEALALNNSKALYQHWSLFIPDSRFARSRQILFTLVESDSLPSVRLQAVAALDAMLRGSSGYLAIANDKPSKVSFTSLSSKLGELVTELHSRLTVLLSLATQPDILLSLLRLAETLGKNSPYSRLNQEVPAPLTRAIIPLVSSHAVGIAALDALCAIISSSSQDLASSAISFIDVVKVFETMLKLHRNARENGVRAAACRGLGFIVKYLDSNNRKTAFVVLSEGCKEAGTVAAASWALANTCDFLQATDFDFSADYAVSPTSALDQGPLNHTSSLALAISLASLPQSERVQTNGIRCIGSLLKYSPRAAASPDHGSDVSHSPIGRAVEALCAGLLAINPKVRWNSATAIGSYLSSPSPLVDGLDSNRSRYDRILVKSLMRALVESDNYKCRIQAVVALSTSRMSSFGGGEGIREVLDVCGSMGEKVRIEIEDERRRNELAHLLSLEKKLESCIDRLSGLL